MNLIQEVLNRVPDADVRQLQLVLPAIGDALAGAVEQIAFELCPTERMVFLAANRVRAATGVPEKELFL